MQINQPLIWLRYIDDIFFIWTHGEKELEKFMSSFDSFTPNLKFTYESSKKDISFLYLKVSLTKGKLSTDLHIKVTSTYTILRAIQSIQNGQLFIVSYYVLAGFVPGKMTLIGINLT